MTATEAALKIKEEIESEIPQSDEIRVIEGEELAIINGYVPERSYSVVQEIIQEYNAEEGPWYTVEDTGEIHISIDVHNK